jgi:Ca-activated chloride channel family protein
VGEFLDELRVSDEVSLITFGAGEVDRRVPFGADPDLVRRVLESVEGFGTTALYDTLATAPSLMEGARHARRAVLLFTDGVDTASSMSSGQAVTVMEQMADPLYAFGIEPPPPAEPAAETYETLMARLAQASGGRYIRAGSSGELVGLARELRRELGTRYVITFQPSGVGLEKWRRISVAVKGEYRVQAREGYVGTLP